jgi:hypothetical protein
MVKKVISQEYLEPALEYPPTSYKAKSEIEE